MIFERPTLVFLNKATCYTSSRWRKSYPVLWTSKCAFHTCKRKPPLVNLNPFCRNQEKCTTSQLAFYSKSQNHTVKGPPWRILFFGTDEFALPHLIALNENRLLGGSDTLVSSLEVVLPKKARCVVRSYSQTCGLPYHHWPLPVDFGTFDVGVVTSFGHLIPRRIINSIPFGIVNVHPSLLPRWRGASPIQHTILNGDTTTAITISEIRPYHFDIGPVLLQRKYPVPEACTSAHLTEALAQEGAQLLLSTLRDLPTLERLEHEQEEEGITYAHKLSPVNAFINWNQQTVEEIDRQYRALADKLSLHTEWQGKQVKLEDMLSPALMESTGVLPSLLDKYPENQVCPRPGLPVFQKSLKAICVRCKDGWVGFRTVVLKKGMSAQAFYNGYLSKPENVGCIFISHPNNLDTYTFRTSAAQMKLSVARSTLA